MVLRWVAAGVPEAGKGFRQVKGCKEILVPVAASRRNHVTLGWLDEAPETVA